MKEEYFCKQCKWKGESHDLEKNNKKVWKCPKCSYKPLKLIIQWRHYD